MLDKIELFFILNLSFIIMNKFLDYARNYKIQFVCVCACFKVWYIYDDIAAKINLIWLVCDFRREVVLVAKLKHHAITLTYATRKQIECPYICLVHAGN